MAFKAKRRGHISTNQYLSCMDHLGLHCENRSDLYCSWVDISINGLQKVIKPKSPITSSITPLNGK